MLGWAGFGLIKTLVWLGQVISGFLAPLRALLVSHGSRYSTSASILENFEGLSDHGPDDKIKNCPVCLRTDKKCIESDRDRIDQNFGFGQVRPYQVFRPHYLPDLYPMFLFVVVVLQFLKLWQKKKKSSSDYGA